MQIISFSPILIVMLVPGKDAPTLASLSDFLREHPHYSLVKPNAVSAVKYPPARRPDKTPGRVTVDVSRAVAAATGPTHSGSLSAPAGGWVQYFNPLVPEFYFFL